MTGLGDGVDRMEAKRGTIASLRVNTDAVGPVNPEASARRRPIVEIDQGQIDGLVQRCMSRHDDATRDLYVEWAANRKMRHETDPVPEMDPRAPAHRKAYRPQVVQPVIRDAINNVLATPYSVRVKPASTEPSDTYAAEHADAILRYQDRAFPLDDLRAELLEYAVDCSGRAFFRAGWNPQGGNLVGYSADPATGEETAVYQGMIERHVLPPWEAVVDPNARGTGRNGMDGAAFGGWRIFCSRYDLQAMFSPAQLDLIPEMSWSGPQRSTGAPGLSYLTNPAGSSRRTGQPQDSRPYEVTCLHFRRCDELPFGLYVTAINGRVITPSVLPYVDIDPGGVLDLGIGAYLDWRYVGRFWGVAASSMLRPMQEASDDNNTSRVEHDRHANVKFIGEGFARYEKEANTEQGQYLTAPAGGKISIQDIQPSLPQHFTIADRSQFGAERVMGVSQPSRGVSSGDKTAYEVEKLTDATQISIANRVRALNRACENLCRMELVLARLYDEPRQAAIDGGAGSSAIKAFTGANLTGFEDVEVYSDASMPPGPSARVGYAAEIQAMQRNIIADEIQCRALGIRPVISMDTFAGMVGVQSGLFDDAERVEQAARAAMEAILDGQPPTLPSSEFEDWDAYLRIFKTYLQDRRYLDNPQTRALVDQVLRFVNVAAQNQRMSAMGAAQPPAEDDGSGTGADPNDPATKQPSPSRERQKKKGNANARAA